MPDQSLPLLPDESPSKIYGVVGSGSFGLAVANLLAENGEVLLFARRDETVEELRQGSFTKGKLHPRVRPTTDLAELAEQCGLIFPIVPSAYFRDMMLDLGPLLKPSHILIHGTKGLDLFHYKGVAPLQRKHLSTMSEVIAQESVVVRIGCLSGPNLSAEINAGQPAATLLASRYTEVIRAGQEALRSHRFQVYGNHDIVGAELAGALKNIIALGAGALAGRGYGLNLWALLVTRGLSEMIHLGKALGANTPAFLGVAGIGDLIATAASPNSRNYSLGFRVARGETLQQIQTDADEVAEGPSTLETMKKIADAHKVHAPITQTMYRIFFKNLDVDTAVGYLMQYPYSVDVDFL
jgi:glycerol-3-phosphate dehydrogenase (NAD(P)+)